MNRCSNQLSYPDIRAAKIQNKPKQKLKTGIFFFNSNQCKQGYSCILGFQGFPEPATGGQYNGPNEEKIAQAVQVLDDKGSTNSFSSCICTHILSARRQTQRAICSVEMAG